MTTARKKNSALTFRPYPLSKVYRIFGMSYCFRLFLPKIIVISFSTILGKRFQFSGPITIFAALGFVAGYLDGVTLTKIGVYVTMSTGNILRAIISLTHGDYTDGLFALCMVFFNTIIGGVLASFVFEHFPSKYESFMILSVLEIIACIISGVTLVFSVRAPLLQKEFSVLALAISNGAMLFWSIKLGFSYAIHTVTLLKIAESGYKVVKSIVQGGQKLRGDILTVLFMFSFFVIGAFSGIYISRHIGFYAFFCLIPIHLSMMIHIHFYSKRMDLLTEEEVLYVRQTLSAVKGGGSPHGVVAAITENPMNNSQIGSKSLSSIGRPSSLTHRNIVREDSNQVVYTGKGNGIGNSSVESSPLYPPQAPSPVPPETAQTSNSQNHNGNDGGVTPTPSMSNFSSSSQRVPFQISRAASTDFAMEDNEWSAEDELSNNRSHSPNGHVIQGPSNSFQSIHQQHQQQEQQEHQEQPNEQQSDENYFSFHEVEVWPNERHMQAEAEQQRLSPVPDPTDMDQYI